MIRMSRIFLFSKKLLKVPLLNQHATSLPKQVFVEFSVVANEESPVKQQASSSSSFNRNITRDRFHESYEEIKYSSLRQIFSGAAMKTNGYEGMESMLKDFFNNVSSFPPSDIIKVLELLSRTNNRPIISIKALCSLLSSNTNLSLPVNDYCTLLCSLSKLSYKDQELLNIVAENLRELDDFNSPKAACVILHSLSDLKFKDSKLLDKLFTYVLSKTHSIKILLSCLKTASLLNYQSEETNEFIKLLSQSKPIDFVRSTDYINLIWSCVILNKQDNLTYEQISAALSENFVTIVLQNGAHNSIKWKLLNINGAVRLMKNYKGPLLDNHLHYKIMNLSLPKPRNSFLESVLDTLSYIVPQSANLKPLVNTGCGFYLDFEFYDILDNSEVKNSDQQKVGIVLLNYNDICSDKSLSGVASFKVNMLKNLGYKVIPLSYSEYRISDPLSQKIEFLRSKIDSVYSIFASN